MKNLKYVALGCMAFLWSCSDEIEPYETTETLSVDGSIPFEFTSSPEIEQAIAEGEAIFNKPGQILGGAACANCHAPDAFDLAFFDFAEEDIRRRAAPHVSEEDADAIVRYVDAIRERYNLTQLASSREHRLFQPGGSVLNGSKSIERDFEFLKTELPKWVPSLFTTSDVDEALALQIRDELADINLQEMRIGIEFPLWASDHFHGDAFGTVNEWMPNLPCLDSNPRIQEIRSNYSAYPSRANLRKLIDAVENYSECSDQNLPLERGNIGRIVAKKKYISGLMAMHLMREKAFGMDMPKDGDFVFGWWDERVATSARYRGSSPSNRIWEIGDHFRKPLPDQGLKTGTFPLNSAQELLEVAGFDLATIEGQTSSQNSFLMKNEIQSSWFWLNGTFDSHRHTGYSREAMERAGFAAHAMIKANFDFYKLNFGNFSYSDYLAFHPMAHVKIKGLDKYAEAYAAPSGYLELYDELQVKLAWTMLYVTKNWIDDPDKKGVGKNDDLKNMALITNFLWRVKKEEAALEWYYEYGGKVVKNLNNPDVEKYGETGFLERVLDSRFTGGPGELGDHHGVENMHLLDGEDGEDHEYYDMEFSWLNAR